MLDFHANSRRAFPWLVALRLLAIYVPVALVMIGVVMVLDFLERRQEHTLHEQASAHIVELHGEIINREMKLVTSDLLYLANQAILQNFLTGKTGKTELQNEYLLFCRQRGVYDQIRFLDSSGREQIRINHNHGRPNVVTEQALQFKGDRYYFVRTMRLQRGRVFVSPLDLNVEHNQIEKPLKPVIRFATPIHDQLGNKKGILILNYLGAGLIEKLVEVSVPFPGTTLLLNGKGYFLRGPSRDAEWGFMLGHNRTFGGSYPEEWQKLTEEKAGAFVTSNGLLTFRTLRLPAQRLRPLRVGQSPDHRQSAAFDGEAADPTLIVVSHISPEVLHGQSTMLLRRLLVLLGVVLVLFLGVSWFLAYAGTVRRQQRQHLAESETRLRTLSTQLITAQEDERRRLSRDLHDELGQLATAVALDLQQSVHANDSNKKANLIGRALHETECLLARVHEIAAGIRPALLDDLGLKDALQNLLSDFERRTDITAHAELVFAHENILVGVAENIYRILHEALTNVAKHAKTQEVFVSVRANAQQVILTIQDEGVGFSEDNLNTKRLGILGMRERTHLQNGTFVLNAMPGIGTTIAVTIPIPGESS